jgi:fluoride exporter
MSVPSYTIFSSQELMKMKVLLAYLWVALGGGMGAMARFAVARAAATLFGVSFPYGTFIINISGSFLLGLVAGLISQRFISYGDNIRLFIAIGFLGAYTTFSTFAFESNALLEDGKWIYGVMNLIGSLLVGVMAVRLGIVLSQRWLQ